MFKKYQHIERFGTDGVEGIEIGECHIFYKLDGTNASVWYDNGIQAGSRNRHLSEEKDNAGFFQAIKNDERIIRFFNDYRNARIYGEWLVPHSINTYRDDSWRKLYIFDVEIDERLIPYSEYSVILDKYGLDYIPPLCTIKNPSYDSLVKLLDKVNYLMKDGYTGEGIVIKNYSYRNKYGRQTWAKIVSNEFKEKNVKVFGVPEVESELTIEERIIDKFCTESFIEKEFQKIKNEKGWNSKLIPMLLGKIFYELITEETFNMLKEFGYVTIDFKRLNNLVVNKIKEVKKELFA